MDNEHMDNPITEEEKEVYKPRPLWQIILAWVGVGIVAVSFILYLINIATAGGL